MEVIQITRKVTGNNYSNIELTATLNVGDDPVECAINLDKQAREMLVKIEETKVNEEKAIRNKREKLARIEKLREIIEGGVSCELPF